MSKIFVSHSSQDHQFVVREILRLLEQHQLEAWYSADDIRAAEHWDPAIQHGLKECDWFLLVMSPHSARSEWVRNELHWAMVHRAGRVVPVLIQDCELEEFHLGMPRIQYVDFRSPICETSRQRLLAAFESPNSLAPTSDGSQLDVRPVGIAPIHLPRFPFHCGFWVPPEFFVGRKDELQMAMQRIRAGQNLLVVGYPRAGKTSFCYKLIDALTRDPGCALLTSYVNLDQGSHMTITSFLERTILNIIGEMARRIFGCKYSDLMRPDPSRAHVGLSDNASFQSFVNIFRIVRQVIHRQGNRKAQPLLPHDFVSFVTDLLEIAREEGRDRVVIFYDEANRLPQDIETKLLNNIGETLSQTGVTGCYVASPGMAQQFGGLYGLFADQIHLGPFRSIDDMRRLLARYYFSDEARTDELPVTSGAADMLWEFSGGRPYLIQLLADRMFQLATAASSTDAEVEHVDQAHRAIESEHPEVFRAD